MWYQSAFAGFFRTKRRAQKEKRRSRPRLEALEDMVLPSTVSWNITSSGSWLTPGNWSTHAIPQPGDDVVINEAGGIQVTLNGSTSVNSLTITGDSLAVTGGTLTVAQGVTNNGGAITVSPGAQMSASGQLSQNATASLTLPGGSLGTGVGTELLGNPGFESPTASGSTTAPGTWWTWGTPYLSTQYAQTGSQALLESGSNTGAFQVFGVTPGVSYTGSVYAMTPASAPLTGSEGAFLKVLFFDSNGNQISPFSPPNSVTILDSSSATGGPVAGSVGNQGWNFFSTTAVAPGNAATVDFMLQVGAYTGASGTAGGDVFWDNAQFGPTAVNSAKVSAASITNSGVLSVGSADSITTSGDFTQTSTGSLTAQLGGPAAGNLYGTIVVGETASLSGALQATLVNNYAPSINDGFNIISYASASGAFTTYQLPTGSGFVFQPAVNPEYLGVEAVPPGLSATVNVGTALQPVSTNMVGINLTWWDDQLTTTETQQMVEAAGLSAFRFPGGSSSDDYHFNVSANFGDSGADTIPQFAQFIQSVSGVGLITLDYGSGSPQEAAAELAYLEGSPTDTTVIGNGIEWNDSSSQWQTVNWQTVGYWASLRAATPLATNDGLNFLRINHPTAFSNIQFWEVGNEEYGGWEVDHHGTAGPGGVSTGAQHDPATYAAFAKSFATYAAEIDPSIKIGIDSEDPTGASDNNWTKNVLTAGASIGFVPGFISDHSYVQGPGSESDYNLLFNTVSDPSSLYDWSTRETDYESLLQSTVGSKASQVQVMATEFNSVYTNPGKQSTSLVNGLFVADSIGSLLDSGYTGGFVWDLRNGYGTGNNNSPSLYGWREGGDYGILGDPNDNDAPSTGPYVPYPTYFAEQLASKVVQPGGQVVSTTSNYDGLSIYAVKEANGDLEILAINKDPDAALPEQINLQGYQAGPNAEVWQYDEVEDDAQSQSTTGASALGNFSTTLPLSNGSFTYTFPAYSMTVLVLTPGVNLTLGISGPIDGYQGVSGQVRGYTFTATPSAPVSGETFKFTIHWGDNSTTIIGPAPSVVNSSHVYTASGTYTITVTATDQFGATSTPATATATILADEMQGSVLTVGGTTGNDKLAIGVTTTAGKFTATLNGKSLGAFTPTSVYFFSDGGSDTVVANGGASADSFTLAPGNAIVNGLTLSGDNITTWQLNGSGGNNTFTVVAGAKGTLNGGTGSNTVFGPNIANTWRMTGANAGQLNATVNLTNIQNLTGGTNTDTFKFMPAGSVLGTIAGGGGTGDTINYASYDAPVTVNLQTQTATAVGSFSGIDSVVGANMNDTLIGPDAGAVWSINGVNSGNASGFAFRQVENLVGGAGTDTFTFGAGASITGALNGGGGTNELTYVKYTTNVAVDLATGSATGVGKGVSNIQIVRGGSATNTLTGGAQNDVLIGGTGSNVITGGSAASVLIGGAGADTLVAGSGSGDILIGGSTSFDGNLTALIDILAQWARTDESYAVRVAQLRGTQSGGLNSTFDLKSGTIHDSAVADVLTGGPGLDWFWANVSLDTINNLQSGEDVN